MKNFILVEQIRKEKAEAEAALDQERKDAKAVIKAKDQELQAKDQELQAKDRLIAELTRELKKQTKK